MADDKHREKEQFCDQDDHQGEEEAAIGHSEKTIKRRRVHLFETMLIITGPVIMSLFLELVGPTLPDLMHRVDCHFEQIARTLAARGAGHMISALAGGVIATKMKDDSEAFLSLGFFFGAIGTMATPWCRTLVQLTVAFLLQGLANGTIDTLSTIICTRLWRQKAALPLHILHFGYGVGGLIAPQLTLPFLVRHIQANASRIPAPLNDSIGDGQTIYVTRPVPNGTEPDVIHDWTTSRIEIPYAISGLLSAALGLALAIFHFCRRGVRCAKATPSEQQQQQKKKIGCQEQKPCQICSNLPPCSSEPEALLYVACLLNVSFMLFTCNGGLHGYTKFLYSFATEGDQAMSDRMAAMLNTAFWFSFTGGRGASMLVSRWTSPMTMLWVEVVVNVVSGTVLFFWADSGPHSLILWIGTCCFGFSIGPVIPTVFSCANLYVPLEGFAVALFFLNLAFGMMGYQYFAGYLFDVYGPKVLMSIVMFHCSTILLSMVIMCVVLRYKTNRFEKKLTVQVVEEEFDAE